MENSIQIDWTDNSIQIDWTDNPWGHIIRADIPGLAKENVRIDAGVDVEGMRTLHISGDFPEKEVNNDETYLYSERPGGRFSRTLRIPDDGNVDEVKPKMENGVLTLIIPKKRGRERRILFVQISG